MLALPLILESPLENILFDYIAKHTMKHLFVLTASISNIARLANVQSEKQL